MIFGDFEIFRDFGVGVVGVSKSNPPRDFAQKKPKKSPKNSRKWAKMGYVEFTWFPTFPAA